MSRASPVVTGASTSGVVERARRAAGRGRATRPPGRSARGSPRSATPSPSSSPARRLRDCGASAVATRSPVPGQPDERRRLRAARLGVAPDLGEDVPGRGARRVQALRLGRARRQRGRVLRRARQLDADRVVGLLAHDARAHEHLRDRARRAARSSTPRRAPRPRAPSPARARARRSPRRGPRRAARAAARSAPGRPAARGPWPATRPPPAPGSPASRSPAITSSRPRDGTPRNTNSAPLEPGADVLDAQLARQLDAGQVVVVLAVLAQLARLLGRARLQRRPQPAAREQHRDRGAERAGADDDGAAARGGEVDATGKRG